MRVRQDKCEFFKSSVEYLGHVIDSAGLHKASSKVKAIVEAPSPNNVTQLRSFLGLLTYYARFVPNLDNKLKPLHKLLNNTKTWEWTSRCKTAFREAKMALSNSDALIHFDPTPPIQLACDASPYGVGAVVSHLLPSGEERPIALASRTLSQAEGRYAQIEREALAIRSFWGEEIQSVSLWQKIHATDRPQTTHLHFWSTYRNPLSSGQPHATLGRTIVCSPV